MKKQGNAFTNSLDAIIDEESVSPPVLGKFSIVGFLFFFNVILYCELPKLSIVSWSDTV